METVDEQVTRAKIRERIVARLALQPNVILAAADASSAAVQEARGLGWPEPVIEVMVQAFVDETVAIIHEVLAMRSRPRPDLRLVKA